MNLRIVACALALVLSPVTAWATETTPRGIEPGTVFLEGLVSHPQTLTRSSLESFPKHTVTVTFQTGHGEQTGTYTGALLWDVLKSAAIIDRGKGSMLQRTISIEGRDGYVVVISLSEIDPDYGNHNALLAYDRAGTAAQAGVRLILPRDRRGGRAVNDMAKIAVK